MVPENDTQKVSTAKCSEANSFLKMLKNFFVKSL